MKKVLFIGMLALATCFAMSSCGSKITEAEVDQFEAAINDGNCDEAVKIVESWKGKSDFEGNAEQKFDAALENDNMDLECILKITDALAKLAE